TSVYILLLFLIISGRLFAQPATIFRGGGSDITVQTTIVNVCTVETTKLNTGNNESVIQINAYSCGFVAPSFYIGGSSSIGVFQQTPSVCSVKTGKTYSGANTN